MYQSIKLLGLHNEMLTSHRILCTLYMNGLYLHTYYLPMYISILVSLCMYQSIPKLALQNVLTYMSAPTQQFDGSPKNKILRFLSPSFRFYACTKVTRGIMR
jgi:hypothetical protein